MRACLDTGCMLEGVAMSGTKSASALSHDSWPGASGWRGRSAEAGVGRLTVWRGIRRVAIQTAPVQWFAVAVEGAIVRRGYWGGRRSL
jgi:hypothetical protein